MVTVAFDRLPSKLYEEGCFAIDPHAPGFPNQLEDTGQLFVVWSHMCCFPTSAHPFLFFPTFSTNHTGISTLVLASNKKLFGTTPNNPIPMKHRPTGFEAGGSLQTMTSRIIHTMWWDGLDDMNKISKAAGRAAVVDNRKLKHVSSWSYSWTQYHSSSRWTYRIWDRISMGELFESEFNGIFYGLWVRLKTSRVDQINLSKYMVLLLHGGVVVGPTMECFKPLDPLVIQTGVVLSYEPNVGRKGKGKSALKVSTDFLSSPPWHSLWWIVLHEIKRRIQVREVLEIKAMKEGDNATQVPHMDMTGVDMLTEAVHLYQDIYPDSTM